ncbi:hypothetical protein, partial [Pseudophaeobacter profundi]|uniref:hypothetical protein n=1 Tax=Pseudophaeobacter profundi TaxID=3034152 RepID=UPI0024306358
FTKDDVDTWTPNALVYSTTSFRNGSFIEVAVMNVTLATYNYTSEHYQALVDTVRGHLANIPVDSEPDSDSLKFYQGDNGKLPLTYNMTMYEVVSTMQGKTYGAFSIYLQLDVYAQKKHHRDALASLKTFTLL